MTPLALRVIGASLIGGLVALGAVVFVTHSESHGTPPALQRGAMQFPPQNVFGQSLGSSLVLDHFSPDLVLVITTEGKLAYVNAAELSFDAQLAWQIDHGDAPRMVPAYFSDGRSPAGEFQIGGEAPTIGVTDKAGIVD